MKRLVLCMYSGGLDSAGALYKILTDTQMDDYNVRVHVHHMHIFNKENRGIAEKIAVEKTIPMFQKIRFFTHTTSAHEYNFMKGSFIFDMDLCAFMAGNIIATTPLSPEAIAYVAMGRTATDIGGGDRTFMARMERAQDIYKSVLSLHNKTSMYIFPVIHMTKKEVWDMLPDEIRQNVWSCRTPKYTNPRDPKPCEVCQTCKDMKKLIIQT